jgi:hypothetical protein
VFNQQQSNLVTNGALRALSPNILPGALKKYPYLHVFPSFPPKSICKNGEDLKLITAIMPFRNCAPFENGGNIWIRGKTVIFGLIFL